MKFRWVGLSILLAASITACGSKDNSDRGIDSTAEVQMEELQEEDASVESSGAKEDSIEEESQSETEILEETTEESEVSENVQESESSEDSYRTILDQFATLILSGDTDNGFEGSTGVQECMMGAAAEDVLKDIGYTIADYSGDGIPELIIGSVFEGENSTYINDIYALYTLVDGKPFYVFEGWARNRYCILEDDTIYNAGSNGAMYSIFGTYNLAKDGKSLVCKDYYFTYEKNDDFTEIGFYHNTTGEWDKSVSEEMDITDGEFWALEEDTYTKNKKLELTSFEEYVSR